MRKLFAVGFSFALLFSFYLTQMKGTFIAKGAQVQPSAQPLFFCSSTLMF
jgi:hypothetical protein